MKAICTKRLLEYTRLGVFHVEEGEVVDYTVMEKKFIVRGVAIPPPLFFNSFKVTEGFDKMSYSDFEYILCNYVFKMALLFPEEYNGIRNLVIHDWNDHVIMVTANKSEDIIRVSFDDTQEKYLSYEEALDGIKNHKQTGIRQMVDAREFLDYIASHLVENGGYVGSAEIRFERLEEWLKEMEDKQTGGNANERSHS